jgi:multidrug efflux pump subunit AcrA (membrane-fusion protein)
MPLRKCATLALLAPSFKKGNMVMRASLIVVAVVCVAAIAFSLSAQTPAEPTLTPPSGDLAPATSNSPAPATTAPAQAADSPVSSTAPAGDAPTIDNCLVSAIYDAQISAKEAGVVTEIKVHEGQVVAKGDVLAQIDDAQPLLELRKAEAEKHAAQVKASSNIEERYDAASAEVAKKDYERKLEANGKVAGAVTDTDVEEKKLEWVAATLKIEEAALEHRIAVITVDDKQAEVDAANEAINRRKVISPQDGVIESVVPHLGEWLKPGDEVVHLVRIDQLQVECAVQGDEYNPWEVRDRPVTVYVKLARQTEPVAFEGRITYVDPVKNDRSFNVKASVQNRLVPGRTDEWLLHPGDNASMKIKLN